MMVCGYTSCCVLYTPTTAKSGGVFLRPPRCNEGELVVLPYLLMFLGPHSFADN